jgi:hypothetical protein
MCYPPYMQFNGLMEENIVDITSANLLVCRGIVDTLVWMGEPVGFLTHTPGRVQFSKATAAHPARSSSLGMDLLTMVSSDDVHSKGSLRGVTEMLRFVGNTIFAPSSKSQMFQAQAHAGITQTLETIATRNYFVASMHEGLPGNPEDGSCPDRAGKDTVRGEL